MSPKCQCGSTRFDTSREKISNYRFELNVIHCGVCGIVVGVLPTVDSGVIGDSILTEVEELRKQIAELQKHLKVQ